MRDARIDMRHPLVRSAILQGLSPGERRAAHLALADALDDDLRFDERTWHLAAAAVGPDAAIADALEEVAERARRRSAHAPAAAALERAAELSLEAEPQRTAAGAAAAAAWHAGQPDRASALLDRADPLVADPRLRATSCTSGARSSFAAACSSTRATSSWPERRTSRAGHAQGAGDVAAGARGGRLGGRHAADRETGHRAAALPPSDDPTTRFLADLLVGVGQLYEGETAIGLPLVRDVVARADDFDEPGWVVWAATGAQGMGDEGRAAALLQRAIALARASGAVDKLTYVLLAYVLMGLFAGRFGVAAEAAEGLTLAREAGLPNAAEHAPGDARLVRRAARRRRRVPALRRDARSSSREPAAARSRTRSPSGDSALLELSRRRGGRGGRPPRRPSATRPGRGPSRTSGCMSAPDLVEACVLAGR